MSQDWMQAKGPAFAFQQRPRIQRLPSLTLGETSRFLPIAETRTKTRQDMHRRIAREHVPTSGATRNAPTTKKADARQRRRIKLGDSSGGAFPGRSSPHQPLRQWWLTSCRLSHQRCIRGNSMCPTLPDHRLPRRGSYSVRPLSRNPVFESL
jgi:hypothetical protein